MPCGCVIFDMKSDMKVGSGQVPKACFPYLYHFVVLFRFVNKRLNFSSFFCMAVYTETHTDKLKLFATFSQSRRTYALFNFASIFTICFSRSQGGRLRNENGWPQAD
jgi:hypothetical protein